MAAPITKFYQFSATGVSPVGSRHLTNHASFVKELSDSEAGALDFGTLNIDSKSHTPTKCLIFRVSDLNGNSQIDNMRFWAPSLPTPAGYIKFNMHINTNYLSGIALTDASGQVPTTLPDDPNLLRTTGVEEISGIVDTDVSEFIYLNVTSDVTTTTGRYGGDSSLRYRVTFDYR